MAAPLSSELMSKILFLRPSATFKTAIKCNYSYASLLQKTPVSVKVSSHVTDNKTSSCYAIKARHLSLSAIAVFPVNRYSERPLDLHLLSTSKTAVGGHWILSRQYGRKVKPKPEKITHFEYSGDLRPLPELDKGTVLYPYQGLEDELEKNEVVKRLSSLEFASAEEVANHKRELIRDRISELFGPDSELEQQIALLTLGIRQMIPYCIKYRTDKGNKIFLLKRIFARKRLLTQLRQTDHERFEWLLRELKIRYVIPRDREEFKGWRHDLKVATQKEATEKQRKKLEELKAKFQEEKEVFYKRKAQVLSDIEKDLEKFGMSRDFLDELLEKEKDTEEQQDSLTWEERAKQGMTGTMDN